MDFRKRFICVILLISILIFVAFLNSGCNNDTANTGNNQSSLDSDGSGSGETDKIDGITEETMIYTPDLPEMDFGGYEFKVYQRGPEVTEWNEVCIYAEAENGELINDAVYRRNRIIEGKYNIEIVPINGTGGIYDDGIKKGFENSVLAGDNAFDMAMSGVYDSSLHARRGMLVDFYDMPYIDPEQPWWDIAVNDSLTIMNRLYFGMSKMGVNCKDDSFCILFNKELAQEIGIENPYQLVQENKWTFDKMIELGKLAVMDLDGDGAMGKDDRYGYSGFDAEAWNLYVASGEQIARTDDKGIPYFTMLSDRGVQVLEKIYTIFKEDDLMINTSGLPGMELHEQTHRLLDNKQVLFAGSAMIVVQMARAMEKDFGMLPYPKFDANQDKYYTICGLWGPTAVTVPVTNTELNRTGIIIEALVAESMNTVFPAYYDLNLVIKGLRDEDSKEMLDIIMAGRRYDIGMLYNWGGVRDIILNTINSARTTLVTAYERVEARAAAALEQTMEEFSKIQ